MNLDSQERLAFVLEPGGRTARVECEACHCVHSVYQGLQHGNYGPDLATTLTSCGWRPAVTGALVCGPNCADMVLRLGNSAPFSKTGDEVEAEARAKGTSTPTTPKTAHVIARCVRCDTVQEVHAKDGAAAAEMLTNALGWHVVGGKWLCSKLCHAWHSRPKVVEVVKPVERIDDQFYQRRRAELTPNRLGFAVGEAPPAPARKVAR